MLLLPASLTQDDASACLRLLRAAQATQEHDPLVVDAHALTRFDSSALALLLECRRAALYAGKRFCVRNAPLALQQLAQLYGVQELLLQPPAP